MGHAAPGDPTDAPAHGGPWARVKLPMTIVVAVLAIALGVAGGFGLTSLVDRNNADGPDDPEQVVRAYLRALADGDAATALSLGAEPPPETTLLTPEVLARAREHAPLTEVEVTGTDGTVVRAEYRLGDRPVTAEFTVVDTPDGPRLARAWGLLRLEPAAGHDLARMVFGVQVTEPRTAVFPGVYPVHTGRELIDWDEDATVLVDRPDPHAAPRTVLRPRLTPAGEEVFAHHTREFLRRCLTAKQLAPEGCPFSAEARGEVAPGSVVWTVPDGDPMAEFEPRIDFDNVLVTTARFDFTVVARWQEDGESMNAERYVDGRATLDISDEDAPVFTWRN